MKLSDVKSGGSCIIKSVCDRGAFSNRLCDMGFLPGTRVTVIALAPFGDPMELFLRGYRITLRRSQAKFIEVEMSERREIWKR